MNQGLATTPEYLATEAIERSGLYGLLARIFGSEPTADLLDVLLSEAFLEALGTDGYALKESLEECSEKNLLEALATEYARLFLGPGKHISPHESIQRPGASGTLWGKETADVRRFIEASGFDFNNCYTGIPDHISVELEFLAHLTKLEAKAWQDGDELTALKVLDLQSMFLSTHLGKWSDNFYRAISQSQAHILYKLTGQLLSQFVAGELEKTSVKP